MSNIAIHANKEHYDAFCVLVFNVVYCLSARNFDQVDFVSVYMELVNIDSDYDFFSQSKIDVVNSLGCQIAEVATDILKHKRLVLSRCSSLSPSGVYDNMVFTLCICCIFCCCSRFFSVARMYDKPYCISFFLGLADIYGMPSSQVRFVNKLVDSYIKKFYNRSFVTYNFN